MWLFRPRLCLGFGKPAPDGIVPLLDKPLLRISDKAAALRLRDGVQLSDGTLHNLPCLPVTDNRNDFFQSRKGFFLRTGGVLIDHSQFVFRKIHLHSAPSFSVPFPENTFSISCRAIRMLWDISDNKPEETGNSCRIYGRCVCRRLARASITRRPPLERA